MAGISSTAGLTWAGTSPRKTAQSCTVSARVTSLWRSLAGTTVVGLTRGGEFCGDDIEADVHEEFQALVGNECVHALLGLGLLGVGQRRLPVGQSAHGLAQLLQVAPLPVEGRRSRRPTVAGIEGVAPPSSLSSWVDL